ncbi:MAG: hypothetical protein Tsb0019_29660 [Roseibium sp.]
MSKEPFAGRAAELIAGRSRAEIAGTDVWVAAAEDCVLGRLKSVRLIGGLPRAKTPLDADERTRRLRDLLRFWANGCTCVIDEELYADILKRHEGARRS